MRWIKRLLGLSTPLEKKRKRLAALHKSAMMAQRNGDLRKYASIIKETEVLEDEIIEMSNESR
jgi:hypothetical protein